MEIFESSKSEIKDKINSGEYTLVKRISRSLVFNVFMDIQTRDGSVLKDIVICEKCKNLYRCNSRCTSNLLRHHCYKLYKSVHENSNEIKLQPNSDHMQKCAELVVQWVVGNCRPLNIINDEGLRNLAQFILNTGQTFGQTMKLKNLLPNSSTLASNIASLYDEQCNLLTDELSCIKNNGFAITCNLWTDNFLRTSYIGATVHYIKNGAIVHKMIAMRGMDNEQNTGCNVRMKIVKILNDFDCKFNKMVTVVTDRGLSMKAAFKNDRHIFCINHLLNNVVEKGVSDVEDVMLISADCAKLIKYLKKTGMNNALNTTLKSNPPTRWHTIFFLFKSIKQNWADINQMLQEEEDTGRFSNINLCEIDELLEVLQPFEESSRILEGEGCPTLHCVYPQIHKLKAICSSTTTNDSEMVKKLKEKLLFHILNEIEPNLKDLHKIALFLYPPANKLHPFEVSEKRIIHEKCKEMLEMYENRVEVQIKAEHVHADTDAFSAFVQNSTVISQEDAVSNEILRYESQNVLYYKDFNLLEWWESHKREYPLLYKLSSLVFATPASSATSERVFSKARHLLAENRTLLGKNPNNVDQIMFLNSNLDFNIISTNTVNND